MLDSDWLITKFLKTSWLDWMNFISARLNSTFILICFHGKENFIFSISLDNRLKNNLTNRDFAIVPKSKQ